MSDKAGALLLEKLRGLKANDGATLWLAGESDTHLINQLTTNPKLTIITNRYTVYELASAKKHSVIFSDFKQSDYPEEIFETIIFRVSKEKPQVHHIIQQAAQLLNEDGQLIIIGEKQTGIKTYNDKIKKIFAAQGAHRKHGDVYYGEWKHLDKSVLLNEQPYEELQKVNCDTLDPPFFFSKPGVFGWNKMDKGTNLLLKSFNDLHLKTDLSSKTALDLGCGYGWIFLNLKHIGFKKFIATDNNAAAIEAATANAELTKTDIDVVADNCAKNITTQCDFVFCNPPFHQGFDHEQELTQLFIEQAAKHLVKVGHAYFVVNQFIGIEKLAENYFRKQKTLIKDQGFKVIQFIK